MRPSGACGRADLARAILSGNPDVAAVMAELLGFRPVKPVILEATDKVSSSEVTQLSTGSIEQAIPTKSAPLADIPFWRVESFESIAAAEPVERALEFGEVVWENRPMDRPQPLPLAPWRELQARLRCEAAQQQETRNPDVGRVAARIAQGRQIERIPYELRRRWGPRLHIIADRSERLIPYWSDQETAGHALAKLLPAHQIERAAIWEGLAMPRLLNEGLWGDYNMPSPGSLVLVLGDLGCLADGDDAPRRFWAKFGRQLAESGCIPAALLPCPLARCGKALRETWRLLPWGRQRGSVVEPAQLRQRAERLLCLVSPALRIEPGFLRAVRLLLPEDEADSGTESDVWQHPALSSTSAAGATLNPSQALQLREAFSREDESLQRQVLDLLRTWRGALPQEIWFEEIQCLYPASRHLLPDAQDLELAGRFFVQLSQRVRGVAAGGVAAGSMAWYRRCERRLTDAARTDGIVGEALHRLSWALHEGEQGYQPGAGFSPELVPPSRIRRLALVQQGSLLRGFEASDPNQPIQSGSPLATVESGNGIVQILEVQE